MRGCKVVREKNPAVKETPRILARPEKARGYNLDTWHMAPQAAFVQPARNPVGGIGILGFGMSTSQASIEVTRLTEAFFFGIGLLRARSVANRNVQGNVLTGL